MILVVNRIPVAEGHEAAFEERFQNRRHLIDREPGFIRNLVCRPQGGEPYLVMTFWADRASFEAWTQSESFRQAHSNRPPREMFSGPSQLEIHEVIQDTAE